MRSFGPFPAESPPAERSRARPARRRLLWGANALLAAAAIPVIVHLAAVPVSFNQFWLARQEARHGTLSAVTAWETFRSAWASGVGVLRRRPSSRPPRFDDRKGVFAYVFSWIPPYAVVYPTEGFYYFRDRWDGREVSGNVRVADLDKGIMSFAYFDAESRETLMGEMGPGDGLSVERRGEDEYRVTYQDKTIAFVLPGTWRTPPRSLDLLPEEEFVGRIHDESGIRFLLLYNRETHSFYETIDEEGGICDMFDPVGDGCFQGRRTRFVYYDDPDTGRKIFMGLDLADGRANNYYDGPGDQIPFRADLRDRLHEAYPSTLTDGGVDPHGVWLRIEPWCRFVIAPFHSYLDVEEIRARVRACDPFRGKSEFWTALTKEWWYTVDWLRWVEDRLAAEGKRIPLADPYRDLRFADYLPMGKE